MDFIVVIIRLIMTLFLTKATCSFTFLITILFSMTRFLAIGAFWPLLTRISRDERRLTIFYLDLVIRFAFPFGLSKNQCMRLRNIILSMLWLFPSQTFTISLKRWHDRYFSQPIHCRIKGSRKIGKHTLILTK